jgi:mono/diheme cytochrome c family protein
MAGCERAVSLLGATVKPFLVAAFVGIAALTALMAQSSATVLDGVYTAEQAARGEAVYTRSCRGCHEAQDADGPLLTGKMFLDRWREDTLDPLYAFIKTNMPGNNPGGLVASAYIDVLAFILDSNGFPAGKRELSAGDVGRIQLVGPDGPRPLSNLTIVRAVGCLSATANDAFSLTRAGSPRPVRARVVKAPSPQELNAAAGQPLGSQTFPLTSVTPQVASLVGYKVQVIGVLTRQGALERINVMSLDAIAATCGG